jgi:hypothetical protein
MRSQKSSTCTAYACCPKDPQSLAPATLKFADGLETAATPGNSQPACMRVRLDPSSAAIRALKVRPSAGACGDHRDEAHSINSNVSFVEHAELLSPAYRSSGAWSKSCPLAAGRPPPVAEALRAPNHQATHSRQKILEPVRRQSRIDRCARDRPTAEPPLDRPGVVAFFGERVAAGVAKHMRQALADTRDLDRPLDARHYWRAAVEL